MEEARVEYLRLAGIEFADLVALGCDLPVVELSVRYHQSMAMGTGAVVKAYMERPSGVRLNWDYQIRSPDGQTLYLTARVTLVAVDRQKGKILRRLPAPLARILAERST